jgi:hypothetical protein
VVKLFLYQQMKRFDMKRRHLAEARAVSHVDPTLHEGHIDASRLNGLEGFRRASGRQQVDRDRSMDCLASQHLANPMAGTCLLTGGHPESDQAIRWLVEREHSRKPEHRQPQQGQQAIAKTGAKSHRPNHQACSCRATHGAP